MYKVFYVTATAIGGLLLVPIVFSPLWVIPLVISDYLSGYQSGDDHIPLPGALFMIGVSLVLSGLSVWGLWALIRELIQLLAKPRGPARQPLQTQYQASPMQGGPAARNEAQAAPTQLLDAYGRPVPQPHAPANTSQGPRGARPLPGNQPHAKYPQASPGRYPIPAQSNVYVQAPRKNNVGLIVTLVLLGVLLIAGVIGGAALFATGTSPTPPPVQVGYRDSLMGRSHGKVIILHNPTSHHLYNVRIVVRAPDGTSASIRATEQLSPGETIEIGWMELERWVVEPGETVEIRVDQYSIPKTSTVPN